MAVSRSGSAFANSFMAGFQTVDNAFAQRRRDAMLQQRLDEEKKQREFLREQTLRNDARAQAADARAQAQEERNAATWEENQQNSALAKEGESIAASKGAHNLSDAELAKYAPYSPSIAAEAQRRGRTELLQSSMETLRPAATAGSTGLTAGVAAANQPQGEQPPSAPEAAAEEASMQAQSQFKPTRGQDSLVPVDADTLESFDPEYQEKGLGGRILDTVAGTTQQATRAAGNVFESGARLRDPYGAIPGPRAAGDAFAGNVFLPAETAELIENFDDITDPDEREAARAQIAETIQATKEAARNPNRNKLARPITRQGALQEGGELARDNAMRAELQVIDRYEKFLDPAGGSALEKMALETPDAAAATYFADRATLIDAKGIDYVKEVDKRMVPVLKNYEAQLQNDLASMEPGTAEARQASQRLANVQASRNEIAQSQPPVAEQAGVRGGNMPVGNQELVNNVVTVATDPNRPTVTPGTMPTNQVRAAVTTASRINTDTRRLSDKQISALVTLYDMNMVDKATMQSVMMTGAWPPGKDPNAIRSISQVNGYAFALTESGGVIGLPHMNDPKKTGAAATGQGDQSREFDMEFIDTVMKGAEIQNKNMTDAQRASTQQMILDFAPAIRNTMNTASEENKLQLGRLIQQVVWMSKQSEKDDGFLMFGGVKDVTPEQLLFNTEMRKEYAARYDQRLVHVPERVFQSGLDAEAIRSELLDSGILAGQMTPEQIQGLGERDLIVIAHYLYNDPSEFTKE